MPIDLAALATTVVTSFLLPYAKKQLELIGKKTTEKLGEEVGKGVSKTVASVWEKVKDLFSGSDQNILERFEKSPETSSPMIIEMLKEKLTDNQSLAEYLNELVNQPVSSSGQSAAQIMNAEIAGIVQIGTVSGEGHEITGVKYTTTPVSKQE